MKVSTRKKLEKIMSVIRVAFEIEDGHTIPKVKVRAVIIRVCGHDPRTVKHYLELLEMEGYIGAVNPEVYVILAPDTARIEDFDIPEVRVER